MPYMPNQLWVSDITYIRTGNEFSYLFLITDGYSRKIVGHHLSKDLSADACVCALKMALKYNPIRHNLIHHSDRGIQYCSSKYTGLLEQSHIHISMTESGDPLENAVAERVNGILKDELLEKKYDSFALAQQAIAVAISVYNYHRPHSSLNMLTPAVAHTLSGVLA